jgi:predicted nucleic acid-binding protein
MKLADINKDSKVFIDTNIFTYHLSGHSVFGRACRDFLEKIEKGDYQGYVNDIVLSEVQLNFIKSEFFKLKGIEPQRVVREIKRKPNLLEFVNFNEITELFESLRIEILPIEYKCEEITKFMKRYHFLPNDAIHIATMKRYGMTHIATNDSDFERVEWITVWKP